MTLYNRDFQAKTPHRGLPEQVATDVHFFRSCAQREDSYEVMTP